MGQIKVTKAPIEGLYVIEPTVHSDNRGYFMETYNQNDMHEAGLDMVFVQDNQSSSSKNTIVQPNKWTQISTNAYINTYASASYFILLTNVNGKSIDYKMSKIEQVDNLTDTATLWTRSVSDTTFNYDTSYRYKQNVDKIYSVEKIFRRNKVDEKVLRLIQKHNEIGHDYLKKINISDEKKRPFMELANYLLRRNS